MRWASQKVRPNRALFPGIVGVEGVYPVDHLSRGKGSRFLSKELGDGLPAYPVNGPWSRSRAEPSRPLESWPVIRVDIAAAS